MVKFNKLDWIALVLAILGGFIWGLSGLLKNDLVSSIFDKVPLLLNIVYIVLCISAVWALTSLGILGYKCLKTEEKEEEKEEEETRKGLTDRQIDHLWEWLLHEDNLFASRVSFFIVAVSMFFAAFAALSAGKVKNPKIFITLGVAGVILISVWIYIARYQIYFTIRPIKEILCNSDKIQEYQMIVSKRQGVLKANIVLGCVFPVILLIVWLVLLKMC